MVFRASQSYKLKKGEKLNKDVMSPWMERRSLKIKIIEKSKFFLYPSKGKKVLCESTEKGGFICMVTL